MKLFKRSLKWPSIFLTGFIIVTLATAILGNINYFDVKLLTALQKILPRFLDYPFSLMSLIGTAEFMTIIWIVLMFYLLIKKYMLAVLALFLYLSGFIAELLGKLFVVHPAPPSFLYRGVFNISLPSSLVHTDYSYPSGHMFRTAFLISFIFILLSNTIRGKALIITRIILIFVLITMSISRIYLAEHWPSDVIGGLLLGIGLGLLSVSVIPKLRQSLQ